MSDDRAELQRLLSPLRDPLVVVDDTRAAVRRTRIVTNMLADVQRATRDRERRATRLKLAGALFAAAASIGLALGVRSLSETAAPAQHMASAIEVLETTGGLKFEHGKHSTPLSAGSSAGALGTIESAAGVSAVLRVPGGIELKLGSASRVGLDGLTNHNRLALERGTASFRVSPQPAGRRFTVVTPFGSVVVHGTVFSVEIAKGNQCVRVSEGVVHVEAGEVSRVLRASESAGCEESTPEVAERAVAPSRKTVSSVAPRAAPPVPPARGTLREETALFQAAIAAERAGNRPLARERFDELVKRFPDSALAPEARAALERVKHAPTAPR